MLQAKDLGANYTDVLHLLHDGVLVHPYPTPAFVDVANNLFLGATVQTLTLASGER